MRLAVAFGWSRLDSRPRGGASRELTFGGAEGLCALVVSRWPQMNLTIFQKKLSEMALYLGNLDDIRRTGLKYEHELPP
jgi:hypothetical protein